MQEHKCLFTIMVNVWQEESNVISEIVSILGAHENLITLDLLI